MTERNITAHIAYVADRQTINHALPPYRLGVWQRPVVLPLSRVAPSHLLKVSNQVVPFRGRKVLLDDLAVWRDDTAQRAVVLLNAPGGHGKTRLAEEFAARSQDAGWAVAFAERDSQRPLTPLPTDEPGGAPGLVVIADYAERWPNDALKHLAGALAGSSYPLVRLLLLSRPRAWWTGLRRTFIDIYEYREWKRDLEPLAEDPDERMSIFAAARDRFGEALRVDPGRKIDPPMELAGSRFASFLSIHMAALVAVDAVAHGTALPDGSEGLSEYLLRREQEYWADMLGAARITTTDRVMHRTVFVATLTGEVARDEGILALEAAGVASDGGAATILDDHAECYPPANDGTWLQPLYPDRLAEDFLAIQLVDHLRDSAAGAWFAPVPYKLFAAEPGGQPAPWRDRIRTMLSEASVRYPRLDFRELLRLTPPMAEEPPPAAAGASTPGDVRLALGVKRGPATIRSALRLLATLRPSESAAVDAVVNARGRLPLAGWAWHISDAVRVTRRLLSTASLLADATGAGRGDLVAALHTAAAGEALLTAVETRIVEHLPPDPDPAETVDVGPILDTPLPAPTATSPLQENLDSRLRPYFRTLLETIHAGPALEAALQDASDGYLAGLRKLAVNVPELSVWLVLEEHRSTQVMFAGYDKIRAALDLLALSTVKEPAGFRNSPQATLHAINAAELDKPLYPIDSGSPTSVPTLREAYVEVAFRSATATARNAVWDERWWEERPMSSALALTLTAHFASPSATTQPFMILGQPGSGKSMLTKVLAATLPPDQFTVVRVPMRSVDPEAPVYEQVRSALDNMSNGRLEWSDLAVYGGTSIRVVLLDGIDEMVLAGARRSAYLADLVEFQRVESATGNPVIVLVTSRTVTTQQLSIPAGMPIVRLEPFDEPRIARWLGVWNAVNARERQPITAESILPFFELATVPLLLMLIATHLATSPPPAADHSSATLYRSLIHSALRWEDSKILDEPPRDDTMSTRLWPLGIAAFGMFNRGRQHIDADELKADLLALPPDDRPTPAEETARAVVGRFWFVYVSEAVSRHREQRTYEFVHATFAEYLLAEHLVMVLREVAGTPTPFGGRRPDDMLFGLLSHRPLPVYGQVLTFVRTLLADLPDAATENIRAMLDEILAHARESRVRVDYVAYQPTRRNTVAALAAYSLNAVALRLALPGSPAGFPISAIAPREADPAEHWRGLVWLWRAGLAPDEWSAAVPVLVLEDGVVRERSDYPVGARAMLVAEAELAGDDELAALLREAAPPAR
jgi:hypothetical protein